MKTNYLKSNQKINERDRVLGPNCGLARKWDHYLEIYDNIWENFESPPRVCEVGVHRGDSLKLFAPFSEIVLGVDIRQEMCDFPDNVVYKTCDQGDSVNLSKLAEKYGKFDIIIDDASHTHDLTKKTFFTLFDYLKPNGFYVIEDFASHTQNDGIFVDGQNSHKPHAILPFAKHLIDEVVICGKTQNREFGNSRFSKIEFYENIMVICKR
jgi:hypothetical protein